MCRNSAHRSSAHRFATVSSSARSVKWRPYEVYRSPCRYGASTVERLSCDENTPCKPVQPRGAAWTPRTRRTERHRALDLDAQRSTSRRRPTSVPLRTWSVMLFSTCLRCAGGSCSASANERSQTLRRSCGEQRPAARAVAHAAQRLPLAHPARRRPGPPVLVCGSPTHLLDRPHGVLLVGIWLADVAKHRRLGDAVLVGEGTGRVCAFHACTACPQPRARQELTFASL